MRRGMGCVALAVTCMSSVVAAPPWQPVVRRASAATPTFVADGLHYETEISTFFDPPGKYYGFGNVHAGAGFTEPPDGPFVPGTYTFTATPPITTPTFNTCLASFPGEARLQIFEVEYGAGGLERFVARTAYNCYDDIYYFTTASYNGTAALDVLTVSPIGLAQLDARVGESASLRIAVRNDGATTLHPTLLFRPTHGFAGGPPPGLSAQPGTCGAEVTPGETCELEARFEPTVQGGWSTVVEVASEATNWAGFDAGVRVPGEINVTAGFPIPPGDAITAITPARLLDTRDGTGTTSTQPLTSVPRRVTLTGRGGVPTGASGVLANVTVTQPTADGHATIYPGGEPRPDVSNLNFVAGQTVANASILTLASDGSIELVVSSGAAHVIVDVTGYLSPTGSLVFVPRPDPIRLWDSRGPSGGRAKLSARESRGTRYALLAGNETPSAFVVNITVTEATRPTFVTAYGRPQGSTAGPPPTSTVNVKAGETRANLAIVDISGSNEFVVYNDAGAAHVIVDLMGYLVPADGRTRGRIVPITPFRAVDTRPTDTFAAYDVWGYRFSKQYDGELRVGGLIFNATVTSPTADGYLVVFPWDAAAIPPVSNLNFAKGQTVPNQVWVGLADEPDNYVGLGNGSNGTADILLDLQAVILA